MSTAFSRDERSSYELTWLLRVVKDHAECVTAARSQTADAVSKVDPVDTPGSLDGTVTDREDHTVTTTKRHDLDSRASG